MTLYSPTNASELTTAISSSTFGDTIELVPGTNYDGHFVLTDKGAGSSWITITTDNTSLLPEKLANYPNNYNHDDPTEWRINATDVSNMPKIRTNDNFPSLVFSGSAHHWKIVGIEFVNTGTPEASMPTMIGVDNVNTIDDFPHDLWFDYCVAHPLEDSGDHTVNYTVRSVEKGIITAGHNITFTHCSFQGFTGNHVAGGGVTQMDSNAILYGSGAGNLTIENCLLESGTQTVWLGGGSNSFAYPANSALITALGSGTITLDNLTGLTVGKMFGCRVEAISDIQVTYHGDPDGASPGNIQSGYAVGKVGAIAGSVVTVANLTSGTDFRVLHVKFGTGVSGGTFTITYFGQTTGAITFPSLAVTGATNASPIVITSTGHGLTAGDSVRVSGVGGNTAANGDWSITVLDADTFSLSGSTGNGAYTSGGLVCSRQQLDANIYAALIALSNLDAADISAHTPHYIYVTAPTFGVHIRFASSADTFILTEGDITIDGTNLTGSGTVACRLEHWWSESFTPTDPRILPEVGAAVGWDGPIPSGYSIKRNIFAHHDEWFNWHKSSGELKTGTDGLMQGNIFHGPRNGMIFEVKNQGGANPWSIVRDWVVQSNIWADQGIQLIAWAPTDGANRTIQGYNLTIDNNLLINPGPPADGSVFGNATVGSENVIYTHNTVLSSYRQTFVVCGPTYDWDEYAGYSQLRDWIVRDNVLLYQNGFFKIGEGRNLGVAPYNHDDLRDGFENLTAENNLIIDLHDYFDNPSFGDFEDFFALHPANWLEAVQIEDIYTGAPVDFTLSEGYEYRIPEGSPYKAGGARQASDGKDVGCDIDLLITHMGFNPFTGEEVAVPTFRLRGAKYLLTT